MRRPIRPTWLLRLAHELVQGAGGRGQPRNTDLRRAVSTAYYAVFHSLALAVVRQALPGATEAEIYGAVRNVSHTAIKQACGYVGGDRPPQSLDALVARLRGNRSLTAVVQTFLDLQDQREKADYDHDADFTRPSAAAMVLRANGAVDLLGRQANNSDFQSFFGLVTLRIRVT